MCVGCERSADSLAEGSMSVDGKSRAVSAFRSPRSLIEQCVESYQQAASYQDDGFVRLEYKLDGQKLEDRAPLSIGWESDGRIGLNAYSVVAGPSSGRWRLALRDDEGLVPNQVLSRAVPSKVDFAWLLDDPLVADRLSAGLAGFPPQLDLLLSDQPLRGLIDESAALSFLQPESIKDQACYVVKVQRGATEFKLWIDQATLLLRRLRLPESHLTHQMLSDARVTDISLTIELESASFNTPVDWKRFAVAEKAGERRVSRFVPAPANIDTKGLGKKIPAFHLEDPHGQQVFRSNADRPERKATLLIWLADHPTCRAASEQVAAVAQAISQQGIPAQAVEIISIWAEPQPPIDATFANLQKQWQLPGILAVDREAMGRDLFNILEAPSVVILDADNCLQFRESGSNPLLDQILPSLLARIVRGEQVAQEIIATQSNSQARHRVELQMAAAIDDSNLTAAHASQAQNNAYEPETFHLRELSRSANPSVAVAATVDSNYAQWTLGEDGLLVKQNTASKIQYETGWRIDLTQPSRIAVSTSADRVALCTLAGTSIQFWDCASDHNRSVDLPSGERLRDFQWIRMTDGASDRLAVITDGSQLLLLDPSDREQLSGHCPAEPMALVCLGATRGSDGRVALINGRLEPLLLPSDLALPKANGLGRKVATATLEPNETAAPMREQLTFQPDLGPWLTSHLGRNPLTLARGWLAKDEPALFMLDQNLNPLWHFRMPIQKFGRTGSLCVAMDPQIGQPVWAVVSGGHTVHVLRTDGVVIDYFASQQPVVDVALVPNGSRLELRLVHAAETVNYELTWK